jgi:hypothetical protein
VPAGSRSGAAAAFAASAAAAGESLTLFAAWAAARSALHRRSARRVARADAMVARALAVGLGQFEARLAEVELLAARDDPTTSGRRSRS